ncbi:MAG: condensation domain-containing protein [Holosporaceae bacterium]|jgi:hypothetical protein|nr:condensation domain-containing protein [Holosporaceae bacterium]
MKASIQENQCFLAELMAGNLGIYTIREEWLLSEDVDACKLKEAFFYLMKTSRHLNRVFYLDDDSILQSKSTGIAPLWVADDVEFNMTEAPLMRAGIYKKDNRNFFKIQFHHSLMDGWSLGLFMKDLGNAYHQKPISFVNKSNSSVNRCDNFSPLNRAWKDYSFLSEATGAESDGILFSLNKKEIEDLKKEAAKCKTTLFPLLISRISEVISEISGDEHFEYAIPFSARNNSNINDIGMFVDTQLLELKTMSPAEIQNKLLELIATPNSVFQYSGTPKIMLNFLDMNILKFALSKDGYPVSYLAKYALFDFQIEFRNFENGIDVLILHRNGVLQIAKNTLYQKIKSKLSGEFND